MPLRCPACGAGAMEPERFCADCGLPLVHAPGAAPPPKRGAAAERARKVRREYTEGPLVRVASARHQAEAELVQNLLLEEGVPSLVRRTGGFDVPDFLASGPREVLVPQSGAEVAHALLRVGPSPELEPEPEPGLAREPAVASVAGEPLRRGRARAPRWVRVLALVLAVFILAVIAAGVIGALTGSV